MSKTLLETYLNNTTFQERNQNPREEGIIATLSDIVERESSFENLPNALPKLHEFHRMLIDRSKVKDEEELEGVATMMTLCLSMMIMDKHFAKQMKK
ncbi:hypothetical protein [Burkholderia cepacia]|uniref:hypothetical protein n=1 Tax=Burkholderia cepacia TaxID=292 RepID=UPI00158B90E6|nr:hypothetical protein [Burkholderia cepacia]